MKKSSLFTISIILMFFYAGLIGQSAAQGIRNEGATINIASGYVVCQGGLVNSSGTVTNNGTLTVTGGITNSASNTIGGDGDYYIGANWTNNGTFIPGSGTVTFNGATQTINGPITPELVPTVFNNLTISSSVSTTILSGYAVTVNTSLTTNNNLIIKSSSLTSSGSLIYSGSIEPSGNVTYNRFLPPDNVSGDRHFFSSPVGGQGVDAFITANDGKIEPAGSEFAIREWNEQSLTANWQMVLRAGSFGSGKGYRLNQTNESNGLFKFTGTVVNSATVRATSPYANPGPRNTAADYGDPNSVPAPPASIWATGRSWVNYGGGGWNLMGNPFTSAMDAAAFVTANSTPTQKFDPNYQALYVYDGNSATPQYLYAAAKTPAPAYDNGGWFSDNIQAGQGFFVLVLYNDIYFNFTPAMQVHNTGLTLLKSAEAENDPWPGLQLKVKYGDKERSTVIMYNNEMTTGCDPGYDVGQLSAGPDVEIYTALVLKDNSVNFARQALPMTDSEKNVIPVGIDTEKGGEVTFSAITVAVWVIRSSGLRIGDRHLH